MRFTDIYKLLLLGSQSSHLTPLLKKEKPNKIYCTQLANGVLQMSHQRKVCFNRRGLPRCNQDCASKDSTTEMSRASPAAMCNESPTPDACAANPAPPLTSKSSSLRLQGSVQTCISLPARTHKWLGMKHSYFVIKMNPLFPLKAELII